MYEEIRKSIGSEFRKERQAQKMTQQDLSVKSGISVRVISNIELGKIGNIKYVTLEKVGKILGFKIKQVIQRIN